MEQQEQISILMGVYNAADTLAEAIESIVTQTYPYWELIICDDASTDDTYAIAAAFQARFPDKIRLIRNDTRSYLAYSLNRCLAVASGTLIARMDADDRSLPERLEKQVAFLKDNPDVVLVGTAARRFDDDGTPGTRAVCPSRPDRFSPHKGTVFNHPTILAYKWVYDALGGYTVLPRTVRSQDLDLWYRFLHAGYQGANMAEELYLLRENKAAFKRRTAHTRWITFQTHCYGYRLLGYPWYWYAKPFVELMKILVPTPLLRWYRRHQNKRETGGE